MNRLTQIAIALSAFASASAAGAVTIIVKSDSTTLGAATDVATAAGAPPTNLSFVPVIVDAQGTVTPVPPGAPTGTSVINLAPGNGQSGFFRSQFTLPVGFTNISIFGRANVDDVGTVYLNGTAIGSANQFDNNAFSSSLASLFVTGVNSLIISDVNSRGGPSGAAYWAEITYSESNGGVPEPATWAMMILGFGTVGGAMRRQRTVNMHRLRVTG